MGGLFMLIVAPIAALLIQMAVSRTREYSADAAAAKYTGTPYGLISALGKLETWSKRIPLEANPATAHMFIIKPFSGSSLMRMFSTHPSTDERIARLQAIFGALRSVPRVSVPAEAPARSVRRDEATLQGDGMTLQGME